MAAKKPMLTAEQVKTLNAAWADTLPIRADHPFITSSTHDGIVRDGLHMTHDDAELSGISLKDHAAVMLKDQNGAASSVAFLPSDLSSNPQARVRFCPFDYPKGSLTIGDTSQSDQIWLCLSIYDAWAIHLTATIPTCTVVCFTEGNLKFVAKSLAGKPLARVIDAAIRESLKDADIDPLVTLVDVPSMPAIAFDFQVDISGVLDAQTAKFSNLPHAPSELERDDFSAEWTLEALFESVSLIYGGDTCWDARNRLQMRLSALRHAVGSDLYKVWAESTRRRTVKELVFNPCPSPSDPLSKHAVNLFRGLPIQPKNTKPDCKLILQHIKRLCRDRDEEFNWLIRWMAYPLQNLGAKMDSSVIMYGAEGYGKSILWEQIISKIYGEYSITIGQAQLESQFTGWQSGKLFALCEEVVSRTERNQHKGQLKHLITGSKLMINEKNLPIREEANRLNFVFLSNSTIPLELDTGDRRYLVLYGGAVPTKAYFDALSNQIKHGGVAAFYWYLMQVDLSGFNQHTQPPLNEDKTRLIEASLPNPVLFYNEWAAGDLDVEYSSCHKSDLFKLYRRWCTQQNEFPRRQRDFTAEIRRWMTEDRKDIHYPDARQSRKTQRLWIADIDADLLKEINGVTLLQNKVNQFHSLLGRGDEQ